jgi:hypothetical protein
LNSASRLLLRGMGEAFLTPIPHSNI